MTRRQKAAGVLAAAAVVAGGVFLATQDEGPDVLALKYGTRIELRAPNGTVIPCGGSVSGVNPIMVKGFATSPTAVERRFRYDYAVQGAWYPIYRVSLPADEEQLVFDIAQDLNPSSPTQTFRFGEITSMETCTITATSIPVPSLGTTTLRPLGDPAVDQIRISLEQYGGDQVPIPCGSTARISRVRIRVEMLSDVAGFHALHTHQESNPPIGTGLDQNGNGLDQRAWEMAAYRLFVPANVWTEVTDTVVTQTTRGSNTFHVTEAGAPEVFCSYLNE